MKSTICLIIFLQLGVVVCFPYPNGKGADMGSQQNTETGDRPGTGPGTAPLPGPAGLQQQGQIRGKDGLPTMAEDNAGIGTKGKAIKLKESKGDQHNKQKKNESNPSPSDVDPSTAFISADLILTRIYWSESLEILFFHIYLPVETNKYVNGNGQPTKPGKTGQIQASVNERVAADMDLLSNLTDEQLVLLFWKLHFLIQAGKITEDGTVIIDGKEYNIADLITSCCPMG